MAHGRTSLQWPIGGRNQLRPTPKLIFMLRARMDATRTLLKCLSRSRPYRAEEENRDHIWSRNLDRAPGPNCRVGGGSGMRWADELRAMALSWRLESHTELTYK